MKDYRIVCDTDPGEVEEGVRELMKSGWVPLGGLSITSHFEPWGRSGPDNVDESHRYVEYAQAMVKP